MAAENLQAMTGLSLEEATSYLEMAGGDLEGAVNLFFSMSGGDGGGAAAAGADDAGASGGPAFARDMIWGRSTQINEAWLEQTLEFSTQAGEESGLVQLKNGPCGALAVIQAVIYAGRLKSGNRNVLDKMESDELAFALSQIVSQCAPEAGGDVKVCVWGAEGRNGTDLDWRTLPQSEVEAFFMDNISAFEEAGGLLLLIFACVETRGQDQVAMDVAKGGGELPLVVGPNLLCSSELLMLLLCGEAMGNVGAYSAMGGSSGRDVSVPLGVGLLSITEFEAGIPVHDTLKSPRFPVWVLHSGDHFTVLLRTSPTPNGDKDLEPPVELVHFNGLPPGGPRLAKIRVTGTGGVAGKAPAEKKEAYVKPVPGEIEDVVQADPDDKAARPSDWKSWRYEVVLAVENPDVTGPERSDDMPPPVVFEQGTPDMSAAWRCASCYATRFQTMCFGQNPPGTESCVNCGKSRADAGWALWLKFDELPRDWQRKMNRRHAPKVVALLQTKWPDCGVELITSSRADNNTLPSV